MSELKHPPDRPRRSHNPRRRRGSPSWQKANGASGSDQVRARCNPAAAPPSGPRGRPGAGSQSAGFWCGVWARGGDWQLNKPANLSSRGRGYRRDLCRYPTQTLGAHRGRKRAAPRAASLNSGSPIARRISAFRAPRAPRRAAPPRPRAASAPISQTCARRRRRPHTPFYHMLGARRPYAVARSRSARRSTSP